MVAINTEVITVFCCCSKLSNCGFVKKKKTLLWSVEWCNTTYVENWNHQQNHEND